MDLLWLIVEWIIILTLFGAWTWYCLVRGGETVRSYSIRWVLTIGLIVLLLTVIAPMARGERGKIMAILGVLLLAADSMLIAAIWRSVLGEVLGGALASIMDGGNRQADKKPLIAQAEGLRHKGKYKEALQSARNALTTKPEDFDALMFIASIQAEDLDRLDSAVLTVEDALRNKRIERGQIVYALNTLADWQLKALQPDAAREYLRRIIKLLPGTDAAQRAEQRIIRTKDRAAMVADAQTRTIEMPEFERELGLKGKKSNVKRKGSDPAEIIAELESQLEKHPNDWTAREELAGFYANEKQDARRAIAELEVLVTGAKAPRQDIVRWLHLIADWHSRLLKDTDSARAALDRIIERYPDTVLAERAEQAKAYLRESR
jgi:tetratricopeptide (TPR) repeat protein